MAKDSTPGASPRLRNNQLLQSDLSLVPGKGERRLEGQNDEASVSKASTKKQRKQSKAALENVKEGY